MQWYVVLIQVLFTGSRYTVTLSTSAGVSAYRYSLSMPLRPAVCIQKSSRSSHEYCPRHKDIQGLHDIS